MTIKIKVGEEEKKGDALRKDNTPLTSIELKMRRALNGDIMIFDHADIDIVLSVQQGKILAFPKEVINDYVYGAEDRLFGFLARKGIIDRNTCQAGNVYGSMEASILPSTDLDSNRISLINIAKFIDEERPYFEFIEKFDDLITDRFTDPNDEDSTELGEVPHEEMKGTLRPGYNYGPYWQSYQF